MSVRKAAVLRRSPLLELLSPPSFTLVVFDLAPIHSSRLRETSRKLANLI